MSMTMYTGTPVGPAFVASAFLVTEEDPDTKTTYRLQLYPDMFNAKLREEKKEMWFYRLPDSPRLARNDQNNWMFNFIKYAGIVDESTHVGATGNTEAAGGIVSFTTTLQVPDQVLARAVERLKGIRDDKLFAWADGLPSPKIGVVPTLSAETLISNIGAAAGGPPAEGGSSRPWAWTMLGEGKSAAGPAGRNAFTGVVGPFAAATLEQAFQGQSSPLFVHTILKHKLWSTPIKVMLRADWERVWTHLSAAFAGTAFHVKADLQGEYNKMVASGVVQRQLFIDGEQIGPERQKEIEARAQLIFDKFVAAAEKVILVPAPEIKPAEAKTNSGLLGLFPGKSVALKARRDVTGLKLDYDEEINQTFAWDNVISAHLKGFFDEIAADPASKAKYFSSVDLGASFKKVRVLATANAYWGSEGTPGDPIAALSVEVGYKSKDGTIEAKNSARFFASPAATQISAEAVAATWTKETADRVYVFDFLKNEAPAEEGNEITVKEHISFKEAPNVAVETLDMERKTTDHALELRADSLGGLVVGPIRFDRPLAERIELSVAFKSGELPEQTLRFDATNRDQDRFFKIWAKQVPGGTPWKYKVAVAVKGKDFAQPTLRWESGWRENVGSNELTVEIPEPPDEVSAKLPAYLPL